MRRFLCVFLLAFAVAFAGCEPANNSGNSGGSSGGSSGDTNGSGGETGSETGNSGDSSEGGTSDPDPSSGKWDAELWQVWLDTPNAENGNYTPGSIAEMNLQEFITWANKYFPAGIANSPNGAVDASAAWKSTEWQTWFNANTDAQKDFPGIVTNFVTWAKKYFPLGMPNTPPGVSVPEGPWKLKAWMDWLNDGNGGGTIKGVSTLTDFIRWANANFPDGIPLSPIAGYSGTDYSQEQWSNWLNENADKKFPEAKFYSFFEGAGFFNWLKEHFPASSYPNGMPNAPPSGLEVVNPSGTGTTDNAANAQTAAAVQAAADAAEADIPANIVRTLEEAGMTAVE
ncbi:MAG: hypothetical protein LBH00_13175 [Planctomycetaceae bacterium]|jgi:hypothetical protein|nr:hypothetical protein [Planctomycetaceae bacterium]